MLADLVFAPEVEQDVREAYDWHEERQMGLGSEENVRKKPGEEAHESHE